MHGRVGDSHGALSNTKGTMPTTSKNALQKFLLNLLEEPRALHQLKMNPSGFIKKSTLAKAYKQILLSNNLIKIKGLVSNAVAKPEFVITIHGDATGQPAQMAAFHIHIGAAQPQVQVTLKQGASKARRIYVSAIHITADPKI